MMLNIPRKVPKCTSQMGKIYTVLWIKNHEKERLLVYLSSAFDFDTPVFFASRLKRSTKLRRRYAHVAILNADLCSDEEYTENLYRDHDPAIDTETNVPQPIGHQLQADGNLDDVIFGIENFQDQTVTE